MNLLADNPAFGAGDGGPGRNASTSLIFGLELTRSASSGGGSSNLVNNTSTRHTASSSIREDIVEAVDAGSGKTSYVNAATGEFRLENTPTPTTISSPGKASLYKRLTTISNVGSNKTSRTVIASATTTTITATGAAPGTVEDLTQTLKHTSSWRATLTSQLKNGRPIASFAEIEPFYRHLRNARGPKLAALFATTNNASLEHIQFENSAYSLDELEVCAVIMLERMAPAHCFSGLQGMHALVEFVAAARAHFKPNPYHDFRHAVDGMQFMFHLITSREDVAEQLLGEELTKFLLVLASLCQDLMHDGRAWGKAAAAAAEQEDSALERMHFAHCERLVRESKLLDFLPMLDESKFFGKLRALILCTDMNKHDEFVQQFTRTPTASSVFFALMKLCDVSNVAREFDEAKVWALRLEAEAKLNGSFVGNTASLREGVMAFSNRFVLPLTTAMQDVLGLAETGRDISWRIEANIYRWTREEDAVGGPNPGL